MNLRHPGFIDTEKGSYLLHGEFFVVVQRQNQALPFRQAVDCLTQDRSEFVGFEPDIWVVCSVVRVVIDFAFTLFIGLSAGFKGADGEAMQLIDKSMKFFKISAKCSRGFFVGGGSSEFLSKFRVNPLEILALLAKRSRGPVQIPETVEDG